MEEIFSQIAVGLNEIKNTQGSKAKFQKLEELFSLNPTILTKVLQHLYDPQITTGIAKTSWKKAELGTYTDDRTILGILTFIQGNNTGKDSIVSSLKGLEKDCDETEKQLLYWLATKDIKIGLSTDTVKKLVPLSVHEVMLGTALKEVTGGIDEQREYLLTEKLDGINCSAKVDNGEVTFINRNGKPVTGLTTLEKEYKTLPNGWYHGELLFDGISSDRKEHYRKTVSEVNSDKENKQVKHFLFAYTKLEEWQKEVSLTYKDEIEILENINTEHIAFVGKYGYGIGTKFATSQLNKVKSTTDMEGLMLRYLDSKYEFKRSKNLIKLKQSYTLDLRIIGFEEGDGKYENQLGAFIVDYKGNELRVGSGLKEEERIDFWNRKEELLNKIIEISYFDETQDMTGKESLRFPVFQRLRLDKNEVSYN